MDPQLSFDVFSQVITSDAIKTELCIILSYSIPSWGYGGSASTSIIRFGIQLTNDSNSTLTNHSVDSIPTGSNGVAIFSSVIIPVEYNATWKVQGYLQNIDRKQVFHSVQGSSISQITPCFITPPVADCAAFSYPGAVMTRDEFTNYNAHLPYKSTGLYSFTTPSIGVVYMEPFTVVPDGLTLPPYVNLKEKTFSLWEKTINYSVSGFNTKLPSISTLDIDNVQQIIQFTTNVAPGHPIGDTPVPTTDACHVYDPNPNVFEYQNYIFELPLNPTANSQPTAAYFGPIGFYFDNTMVYAPISEAGTDPVVQESLDPYYAHVQEDGIYHRHNYGYLMTNFVFDSQIRVVGFIIDGFPLVAPFQAYFDGVYRPVQTSDLDECHGIAQTITFELNGQRLMYDYFYVATFDFPYIVSAFRGTPVNPITPTPPPEVSNVVATVINDTTVSVSFDTTSSLSFNANTSLNSEDSGTFLARISDDVTVYTATSIPGSISGTGLSSPVIVTGLTPNTVYTFTVTGTNSAGSSPPSTPSNPVVTVAVDAPTNVVATSQSSTTATVTFSPVTGATSYTTTSSPGGVQATSSTTTIQVAGLTPATTYTFTVVAFIGTDSSSPSSPSNPITTRLDPPTNVVATSQSSTTATVSFSDVTGATSYTVTSSPGGIQTTSSMTTIPVGSLTPDVEYTFTVVATTSTVTSIPSTASNVVVSYTSSYLQTAGNWPIIVSVPSSITIAEDVNVDGSYYFDIQSPDVMIDGLDNTFTITSATDGLFRNGTSTLNGFNNVTIKNVVVEGSPASINDDGGWVCQSYFGKGASSNVVQNCNSQGNISGLNSGCILGSFAGSSGGNVSVTNCFSTGAILGTGGGGIFGSNAASGGTVSATKCYSKGNIGDVSTSGGIFGGDAGSSNGSATATNCYFLYGLNVAGTGSTVSSSNIYGPNYPSGTWNDIVASSVLTGDPTTYPGSGTVWTSVGSGTPFVLTGITLATPVILSVSSPTSTSADVVLSASVPDASSYTATSNPGGHTGTSATTTITVNGLSQGTTYTFTVVATNGTTASSLSSSPSTSITTSYNPYIASASVVDYNTITLTGTAYYQNLASVQIYQNGSAVPGMPPSIQPNGTWSWTSNALSAGLYTFYATQIVNTVSYQSNTTAQTHISLVITDPTKTLSTVELLEPLNWPIIVNPSGACTVTIAGSVSIPGSVSGYGYYFDIQSPNVTIDGGNYIFTITSATDGLFRNGASSQNGYNNVTIKNVSVNGSGATLNNNGGWLCQQYFGKGASTNVVEYCNSQGIISNQYSGGIVGADSAINSGSISVSYCYSEGAISGLESGGIFGVSGGANSGSVVVSNCYSLGNISNNSGGIFGKQAGFFRGSVTVTNCYSQGQVAGTGSGGIFALNAGSVYGSASADNCYFLYGTAIAGNDSSVTETNIYAPNYPSGTWNDTTASSALTGVPASIPGPGTVWTSTSAGTPFILTGTVPATPVISNASSVSSTSANVVLSALVAGATSYTATSNPGGLTGTSATTTITVNGLSTDVEYTFTVVATNGTGSSFPSSASNVVVSYSSSYLQTSGNWPVTVSVPSSISIADNVTIPGTYYFDIQSANVTIDGLDHTFTITSSTVGLFRNGLQLSNGYSNVMIKNVAVDGSSASLNYNGGWVCRDFFGKNASGNTVQNCYSTGTISGDNGGGIIGASAAEGGSISVINCYSLGNVTGINAGGIFGANTGAFGSTAIVTNCYFLYGNVGGRDSNISPSSYYYGANGTWSDTAATAPSALTGYPTTIPGPGTVWTSTSAGTPFILTGTVPATPVISNASSVSSTSANVVLSAPVAGATSYTATSSPGGLTGTSATTTITVNSLTSLTTYTFTVVATNGMTASSFSSNASNSVTTP